MDKEIVLNKIKEKLSEELKDFVGLNFKDSYEDIQKSIEDFVRENISKEPLLKHIDTILNEKGDGIIMKFELNPSYKHLLEEV